ncbi:MAG: phenylalanine--tRNA ligase beta subunit-related protein [Chloroflexaceae bacterium]|nr:phenylalanine--tRNA ligase beta subunit-related protein [Chloroflexaceae bacterium]
MQLLVEDAFWELFPQARIGIVTAHGLDNRANADTAAALLMDAAAARATTLEGADIATHPMVAPWRAAYARFGVKPSKFRSSIESMLRSAQAGRVRPINPLVDLYNTVSLRHALPCGGEDLAAIVGDVRLTRAAGGEPFRTIGASEDEPPVTGEVIYRDDVGAICRCWNWREADRTKLTPQTHDAVLVIEALAEHPAAALEAALAELSALVRQHLGARTRSAVLTPTSGAYSL